MHTLSRIARAAIIAIGATGIGAAAQADDISKVTSSDVCPANLSSLRSGVGTVVSCWCPEQGSSGSIWGSGPYTVDSDACGAARHAGVVPAGGGAIWVRITEGQSSYSGSTANGITTSRYGSYGASIKLAARSGSPAVTATPCPTTMQGRDGMVTCTCAAAATTSGTVWGTDIYTEDSALCRAALHAGAVDGQGGTVTVLTVSGQQSYAASTRNGVASDRYGPWSKSFMFAN